MITRIDALPNGKFDSAASTARTLSERIVGVACLRGARWLDLQTIDPGAGRPVSRPLNQLLQRLIVAHRERFDAAVAAISYPSRNAQPARLPTHAVAKTNALHTAGNL